MIHVIGDSHGLVFSGVEYISDSLENPDLLPFFRTYRLAPTTAYSVSKYRKTIEAIIGKNAHEGDSVMFCFGEIDCRTHLLRQSEMQQRPLEDVAEECASRYAELFDIQEKYGLKVLVWNAVPSTLEDIESGDYSTYGTCRQRNEATRLFNEALKKECKEKRVVFLSIFDQLIDENGLTRMEYYADQIHLSQRGMPLIISELRRQGVLTLPVQAEKHPETGPADSMGLDSHDLSVSTEGKKVLIWCGIREIAEFIALRPHFDLAFVIEAERTYAETAMGLFKNDRGVMVILAASINLREFCRRHGIERVHTLVLRTRGNDQAVLKTLDRFIKKKRVNAIECECGPDHLKNLARMVGDSYRINPLAQKNREGIFKVECLLIGGSGSERRREKGAHLVFNAVYAHLRDEQVHVVHRGEVSIVWSRHPLEGCELYLYINAYSFAGKQKGLDVLLLSEPAIVLPQQYDRSIWSCFDHILTHYDRLVEENRGFTKALLHRSGTHAFQPDSTITEDRSIRQKIYPIAGRNPGICMINGNKGSRVTGELYSKRVEAALWFHLNSAIPFEVFGNPPFPLPNYKGILPADAKLATMARYKYNLCFENCFHPVYSSGYVDKILSCLETRTIPIYLGAPNIGSHIPSECFIDFRSFRDYGDLERFLNLMSDKQYVSYVESIDDFVAGGGLRPYMWDTIYDQLLQIYTTGTDKGIEEVCPGTDSWEWGPTPGDESRVLKSTGSMPLWSFEQLANGSGEVIIGPETDDQDTGDEIIAQSIDRLRIKNRKEEIFDLQGEINRIQMLITNGAAGIDDYYRYSQLLNATNRHEESIPPLTRVIELDPNHAHALNDLAVVHCWKHDNEKALYFYRRSLKANPCNHDALRNFLCLLEEMDRREEMFSVMKSIDLDTLEHGRSTEEIVALLDKYDIAHGAPRNSLLGESLAQQQERFSQFVDSIHTMTISRHDEILGWADKCEKNRDLYECHKRYETSRDEVVKQGHELTKKVRAEFRNKLKEMSELRILIHIPPMEFSPGGYSLFTNLTQALSFMSINARPLDWNEDVGRAIEEFKPSVLITSDHPSYLERIDWNAVNRHRSSTLFKVGLTAALKEHVGTSTRQRLTWAKNHVDFFYSFFTPEYIRRREEYGLFFDYGYKILNLEFAANPLIHFPVPEIKKDLEYAFLASTNQDKWPRYLSYLKDIISTREGFLDGPGWPFIHYKSTSFSKDRYIYARAKVGLNLHIDYQIDWGNELNERTYILAACGVPQLVDNPPLLTSRFSKDSLFIGESPQEYYDLFHYILENHDEAQRRALRAQKEVFEKHTWFHRADGFASDLMKLLASKENNSNERATKTQGVIQSFREASLDDAHGPDCQSRPVGQGSVGYYLHKTAQMERLELIKVGKNAEIKDYVIIRTYENQVVIGEYTQLNPFTVIYGYNGVYIGKNVMIAPHCMIASGNHDYKQTTVPMRFAGNLTKGPIVIEDNVWIGANSTITDGVRIGRDAVVAANSLVNKDVAPYSIVGGVPAKVIGNRLAEEHAARPTDGAQVAMNHGVRDLPRKVGGLLFSKDRAMQLDCTLRSFFARCYDADGIDLKVLYRVSNPAHRNQYERLVQEYPSVRFVEEEDFRGQTITFLSTYDYVLFLVDDNIFTRDFSISAAIKSLEEDQRALGFSLRLGRNTSYSYMLDKTQRLPVFSVRDGGILGFDWTRGDYDFGYPLELSSSIYRVPEISAFLTPMTFTNPNTLELVMDSNKDYFRGKRDGLLCYDTSVTFCNPVNKVQTAWANKSGCKTDYTAESLAMLFDKGVRIDVKRYDGYTPRGCHEEVGLYFIGQSAARKALVSIGIPNYNGLKHIKACLESIARNTPDDHEIVVIDNGSTDGSLEFLRSFPGIILLENKTNVGAPGARNQFLSMAKGEYIVFLDNDTIVTKDWVSKLIEHMEMNPEVGIIGACTNYATGPQLVDDVDTLSYGSVADLEEYARKRAETYRYKLIESPRLISFCVFLRRQVVEKIGGMETSFSKFCFEDDDYSLRSTIAGLKSVVALDVFIHHTGGPQGRGDNEYNAWLTQAWEGFKAKWGLQNAVQFGIYDAAEVASRPFVPSEHYIPLPDRKAVEALIYNFSSPAVEAGTDAATAEIHFGKAVSLREAGDIDSAIEELEQALAVDDKYPEAHCGLGSLYYQKGDKQKALENLSRAVILYPRHVPSLKNLAALALELGEAEDAIGLYTTILDIDPNDVETLVIVGQLCGECGQTENALQFFHAALENDPHNQQAAEGIAGIEKIAAGGSREAMNTADQV